MSGKLTKAATELLPKLPGLSSPPSYRSFFKTVTNDPENKKLIATNGKAITDRSWEALLRKSVDSQQVEKYLGQSTTAEASKIWEKSLSVFQSASKRPYPEADAAVATTGLKIPRVAGEAHAQGQTSVDRSWKSATYADFAKRVKKANSSVTFAKQLMDDAFRAGVCQQPSRQEQIISGRPECYKSLLGQGVDEILEG